MRKPQRKALAKVRTREERFNRQVKRQGLISYGRSSRRAMAATGIRRQFD